MKTLSLPQPNLSALFKRTSDHTAVSPGKAPSTSRESRKTTITPGEYIITALGEGFKQNFLGSDINMEFLTLTVRSYAASTVKVIRKMVVKPAEKQKSSNTTSTSI